MIELTQEQVQAIGNPEAAPLRVVNPQTHELFIHVPVAEYERLKNGKEYDDSPWTDEEMELLAWEAGKQAGWEEMDEYDHYPEKQ
jgi:hypothetical protein